MKRYRVSKEERSRRQRESLTRALQNQALTNYPAIFEGFMARGIPEDQIEPRVNVFTFDAWKALGRHVRKGEHGVKVVTWIDGSKTVRDRETGEEKDVSYRFCRTTTVFHVSQTEPDSAEVAA